MLTAQGEALEFFVKRCKKTLQQHFASIAAPKVVCEYGSFDNAI